MQEKVTVTVYNLLGAELHSQVLSGLNETRLELGDFTDGIFLVKIGTHSTSVVRKVVLQRD